MRVRPEDFGALGDGSSDDRLAIQTAINYLALSGGGTIELGASTYLIGRAPDTTSWGWNYCLWLRAGIQLVGTSKNSTLLVAPGTGFAVMVVSSEISHSAVRNIKFDGNVFNRLYGQSLHQGIILFSAQYCEISGCEFVNLGNSYYPAGAAVMIGIREEDRQDSMNNIIMHNRVLDPDAFVSFAFRLLGNWEEDLEDYDFIRLCCNNTIKDNYIEGTYWNAIELAGPPVRSNIVSGNILKNVRALRGVESDKGSIGNLFIGNIVDGLLQTKKNVARFGEEPNWQYITTAAFTEQGDPGEGPLLSKIILLLSDPLLLAAPICHFGRVAPGDRDLVYLCCPGFY
ncbi:MAG: glycosyl hydrolase family 28-related protein, partial [Candidatus Krumholzibacteria bacterium]|nr:glycosyl hydrolase family 28-related protein [Candidatus Krumholzibacteria bacterium]